MIFVLVLDSSHCSFAVKNNYKMSGVENEIQEMCTWGKTAF